MKNESNKTGAKVSGRHPKTGKVNAFTFVTTYKGMTPVERAKHQAENFKEAGATEIRVDTFALIESDDVTPLAVF